MRLKLQNTKLCVYEVIWVQEVRTPSSLFLHRLSAPGKEVGDEMVGGGGGKGFLGGEWRTKRFKEDFKEFCLMETSPFDSSVKYLFFLKALWN